MTAHSILVSWDALTPAHARGHLMGYKVLYNLADGGGEAEKHKEAGEREEREKERYYGVNREEETYENRGGKLDMKEDIWERQK